MRTSRSNDIVSCAVKKNTPSKTNNILLTRSGSITQLNNYFFLFLKLYLSIKDKIIIKIKKKPKTIQKLFILNLKLNQKKTKNHTMKVIRFIFKVKSKKN